MIKNNSLNMLIKHKLITLFSVLIIMALSAETINYIRYAQGVAPNLFETIAEQANEPQYVLFTLTYVLLFFSLNDKPEIEIKTPPLKLLSASFFSVFLYIILFITANLLYCSISLNINSIFNNVWSYASDLSNTGLNPIMAVVASLYLLFLRFSFIIYLINFVNEFTKKKYFGFWIALIITYIDFMFYELSAIPYPLGILPIEHTRIVYTEAFIPDFDKTGVRLPYYVSVIYWVILIASVYFCSVFINRNTRRKHENKTC